MLYAVDSIYRIPYFNSIKTYFYSNFEYSIAIDSIVESYRRFPNVKNIDKIGDILYTATLYNEETFEFIVGGNNINNRYTNPPKINKRTFVKRAKSASSTIEKSLKLNRVLFFFNDDYSSNLFYCYNSINCVEPIYVKKINKYTNAQLEDSLVDVVGKRAYIHLFVENLKLNKQFYQRAEEHIDQ
jgi:hypothetical protein